ncbi:MAG: hypothetical protein HYY06_18830 [Deltaproteobacteria bacterium]|nr:hypothetical protein [Deltaproteobacteria bacterium]
MLPPRPRLFKALAILGVLIGGFGAVNAVGGVSELSRVQAAPLRPFGVEFRNDREAKVARQMRAAAERVVDRHRRVTSGLTIANGMLSALLFVTSIALSGRRSWARGLMVQAAIVCALYEVPAVAHRVRLDFGVMHAQEKHMPVYLDAIDEPSSPEAIMIATGSFMMIQLSYTVGMALLRLLYFGIAIHYLRRKDVRSWFQEPETL